jgi:hypothetical protein
VTDPGAALLQAQLCALALLQYRHVRHEGDERGLETVSHLEELAALFAGTGLGASIITAEHLLGALRPPVDTDEDGKHEVSASFLQHASSCMSAGGSLVFGCSSRSLLVLVLVTS